LNEELKLPSAAVESRLNYFLDLPFRFTIDDVRQRAFKVGAVGFRFAITGQEVDMENGVNFH
jgi:hypothetical protein